MTIHEKQSFVTGELTALLRRIDPTIRGAAYTESNVRAHVVISYEDKPTATIEVTRCDLIGIAVRGILNSRSSGENKLVKLWRDKP